MDIKNLKEKLDQKTQELSELVESSDNVEAIKELTDEVKSIKAQYELAVEAKNALIPTQVQAMDIENKNQNTISQSILEGKSVKVKVEDLNFGEIKTLVSTSAGFPAPKPDSGFTFLGAHPAHGFFDAVQKFRMSSVSELYYVAGTRTNNTGIGTEGVAPTDNVTTWNEVVVAARPVTSWIPVSEAVVNSLTNSNLNVVMEEVGRMAKEKIDFEMIRGNGGSASLSRSLTSLVGVANTATTSSLAGIGTDYRTAIDAMAANIEANGDRPAFLLCHPRDAAKIVNQKTDDRAFVWSNQGAFATYNGLNMIKSANAQQGFVWILGEQAVRLGLLGDVTVEMGYNGTDFTSGQRTLRALVHAGVLARPESIYRLQLDA